MGYREMDLVWDKSQARKTDKLVLLAIARRYSPGKGAWPSQNYLAKVCGIDARSVRNSIARLGLLGELYWITGSAKSGKANTYFISFIDAKTSAIADAETSAIDAKTSAILSKNFLPLNNLLNTLNQEGFEVFWSVYPRKENKARALDAWSKLAPTVANAEIIITAARAFRDSVGGRELRFVPLAHNWLLDRRFEDVVVVDDWTVRAIDD